MSLGWQMPERGKADGQVNITQDGDDDDIFIVVTHNGKFQSMVVTPYNAARIVGMLAVFLGMNLGKLGKAIKL